MAIVLITDVLDELSEENQRLFSELRYCQQLIDNYRHLANSLQTNCVCIENNVLLKTQFNEIDVQYNELKSRRQNKSYDNSSNAKKSVDNNKSDDYLLSERPSIKRQFIKRMIKTTTTTSTTSGHQMIDKSNIEMKANEEILSGDITVNKHVIQDITNISDSTEALAKKLMSVSESGPKVAKTRPKPKRVRPKQRKRNRQKKYFCQWTGCSKGFRYNSELIGHERLKHTGERPYQCLECPKSFCMETQLRGHRKASHGPDGRAVVYRCQFTGCDKWFRQSGSLKIHHLKQHTDHRPWKCDVDGCGRTYHLNHEMQLHRRVVHSDDRPFECDWPGCDKRFKRMQTLNSHREYHIGDRHYRCPVDGCGKSYPTRNSLIAHNYSHTKPHVCSWPACEARFRAKNKLRDHMNGHQGLKPYKCHFPDCDDVCYSARSALEQHLKHKHSYLKSYHYKV
ncbi:zinc finger protein 836-like [Oppia nitens]|uniref:zinc finger protein 836-like n=1 Tax=Oppia nitens TaxID=1686743 RepID=UPI0023DC0F6D|nr:zinc finger protein 836-like [Oppia nitens]